MTESEWLSSNDPARMLAWLTPSCAPATDSPRAHERHPSDRKLRLWLAAMASHSDDRRRLYAGDNYKCWNEGLPQKNRAAGNNMLRSFCDAWCNSAQDNPGDPPMSTRADLLRCIVGNPFRPVTLPGEFVTARNGDPELRRWVCPWLTPTVLAIAQSAYDERDWDRLPILADALEDAGCSDKVCKFCGGEGMPIELERPQIGKHKGLPRPSGKRTPCPMCKGTGRIPNPILAHLRGPGPHARGCHVVDAVLGLN